MIGVLLAIGIAFGGQAAAPAPAAAQTTLPEAVAQCHTQERHGQAAAAQRCYQGLAASADLYLQAEGDWGLGLYDQANQAFRAAVAQNGGDAEYRVRWGRLLHARFNDTDAEALFQEALQRN